MNFHWEGQGSFVFLILFSIPFLTLFYRLAKYFFKRASIADQGHAAVHSMFKQFSVPHPDIALEDHQRKTVRGQEGKISWLLVSDWRKWRSSRAGSGGTSIKQHTNWITPDVRVDSGKYFMLMTLPKKIKIPKINKGGWANAIVNWFAEHFLDLFVSGYFGPEYKELINIRDGKVYNLGETQRYYVLSNDEYHAEKFINRGLLAFLDEWRDQIFHDGRPPVGMLVTDKGVIMTTQVALLTEREQTPFVQFSAELCQKILL